ncbi:MAG: hypothetical protein MRERV_3c116 [Mycoplasmataceae bacterium RV_VA103A]|nr:MAG: hypothetical protein MRERV_3c116 [Mycoplasmataceae bacterium RV_VA103A]
MIKASKIEKKRGRPPKHDPHLTNWAKYKEYYKNYNQSYYLKKRVKELEIKLKESEKKLKDCKCLKNADKKAVR